MVIESRLVVDKLRIGDCIMSICIVSGPNKKSGKKQTCEIELDTEKGSFDEVLLRKIISGKSKITETTTSRRRIWSWRCSILAVKSKKEIPQKVSIVLQGGHSDDIARIMHEQLRRHAPSLKLPPHEKASVRFQDELYRILMDYAIFEHIEGAQEMFPESMHLRKDCQVSSGISSEVLNVPSSLDQYNPASSESSVIPHLE